MQALNPTLYLCYAPADRELAERIGMFVARGADVQIFLDAGEMLPNEDLAEKARQASASNMALVLFSRTSLPSRWPRAQWEDALVNEPAAAGVRMGFVKCDDCVPPRVLTPMFEANALRAIKRWARGHMPPPQPALRNPDLEVLGLAIADRPGSESVDDPALAAQFIQTYEQDFDAVVCLDCGERSVAALCGEVSAQLGLRLEADAETNLARLQEFCDSHRLLLVLKDLRLPTFHFEGRTSTLLVAGTVTEPRDESIRGIQHTLRQQHAAWPELCRLARLGRRLTRDAGRMAECHEIIEQWRAAAELQNDRAVLEEAARELVWILHAWDRTEEAQQLEYNRASDFDEQMMLPF